MGYVYTLLMLGNYLPKSLRRGGPGEIFSQLVDTLVHVSKDMEILEVFVINTRIPLNMYVIRMGKITRKDLLFTLFEIPKILKRAQIVYLCGLSMIGFIIFTLGVILKKKTFYHLHGLEILEYKYEEKNLLESLLYIGIEKLLVKKSYALIHVSKLYETITRDMYRSKSTSFIVPNGLDPRLFSISRRSISKQLILPEKYVLFIGRPTRRKGFDTFLILMDSIMDKYNDLYAIAIVGNTAKAHKKLQKYIKKEEIKRKILISEYVDKEILFALYKQAMLTIIPSLIESYNMVALESLALGTPIVISSMAGVAEYLPRNNSCIRVCDNLTCFLRSVESYIKGEITVDRYSCMFLVKSFSIKKNSIELLKILFKK